MKTPSAGSASASRLTVVDFVEARRLTVVDVVVDDVGGPTVNTPIFGEAGVLSALFVCLIIKNTFRISPGPQMGASATAEESHGVDGWALGPKWLVTKGFGVNSCGAPCAGS